MPRRSTQLKTATKVALRRLKQVGEDPTRLDRPFRAVVVVSNVQGIVENGGFEYLFEKDLAGQPPYSFVADAYREIGAHTAAECLEAAVALFPFDEPHLWAARRRELMASTDNNRMLAALSRQMWSSGVWNSLEQYVAEHLEHFNSVWWWTTIGGSG